MDGGLFGELRVVVECLLRGGWPFILFGLSDRVDGAQPDEAPSLQR